MRGFLARGVLGPLALAQASPLGAALWSTGASGETPYSRCPPLGHHGGGGGPSEGP